MAQLPKEDGTPFSLPHDVPEVMPIDHPNLNGSADTQEAYDEGLTDTVDINPYEPDDDPIKSAKRLMKSGVGGAEYYTSDHDHVKRWALARYGHPARIAGTDNGLEKGGLYIEFEDDEPEIDVEPLTWRQFFKIFEKNKLAFIYRNKKPDGTQSKFYDFIYRDDVGRITTAINAKTT